MHTYKEPVESLIDCFSLYNKDKDQPVNIIEKVNYLASRCRRGYRNPTKVIMGDYTYNLFIKQTDTLLKDAYFIDNQGTIKSSDGVTITVINTPCESLKVVHDDSVDSSTCVVL